MDRLMPVLVHVQANLDGDLSLAALASHAGMSARQLHRRFVDALGETPQKYVERLRLERAAFCLRFQRDSILDVALSVGYQSHEVFTRAFQRRFRLAPRVFRERVEQRAAEPRVDATAAASALSDLRVVELAPLHVAFVRHVGPYEAVPLDLWRELAARLRARRIASHGWLLGVGHDAPGITPPSKLRFDACIAVTAPVRAGPGIAHQELPGGLYARLTHVGPLAALPDAYRGLAARLERLRGYRPRWLPLIETYRSTELDPGHTLSQTDIHVPVERA